MNFIVQTALDWIYNILLKKFAVLLTPLLLSLNMHGCNEIAKVVKECYNQYNELSQLSRSMPVQPHKTTIKGKRANALNASMDLMQSISTIMRNDNQTKNNLEAVLNNMVW